LQENEDELSFLPQPNFAGLARSTTAYVGEPPHISDWEADFDSASVNQL